MHILTGRIMRRKVCRKLREHEHVMLQADLGSIELSFPQARSPTDQALSKTPLVIIFGVLPRVAAEGVSEADKILNQSRDLGDKLQLEAV